MGSSESKLTSPTKPEPAIKNQRVTDLIDPRSPSTAIDRTPIQVDGRVAKTECPPTFIDPRSPTVGVSRTPVREVMRATVGSFARRLGLFLHNETSEGKLLKAPPKSFSDAVEEVVLEEEEEEEEEDEELASAEPLLILQASDNTASPTGHANLPAAPVGDSSPFVLLEKPQFNGELETEVDVSLEEAEEARESPLHKRLSMSLITCHEWETSSQILAEVHHDAASSPVPGAGAERVVDGADQSCALASVTVGPETPEEPSLPADSDVSPATVSPARSERADPEETEELPEESASPPAPEPPSVPSPEKPQPTTGIRCPTFDPKSPSQVVFKPQWLGKGFGASGLRARGVQGGKGGSSPLAVRMAVKKVTNENKRRSGKLKQKGTEGRSPLQMLKGTNSPREQRPQTKLKVSNPDKQRLGQIDRRVLAASLDKENR